jgi:hypothetical protein
MADLQTTRGGDNTSSPWVTIDSLTRIDEVAGMYQLVVELTYWHGGDTEAERNRNADPTTTIFHGSVYGAPVVAEHNGQQFFIQDWRQYGSELNEQWVRNYYGIGTPTS